MTTDFINLLAHEGNGAVEVHLPDVEPLLIVIIGPIKTWWSQLDSPAYQTYAAWRDAVRVALIHAGHLVYSPHRAWQGPWHEKAQLINDHAVRAANLVIALTPPNTTATGTDAEIAIANSANIPVITAPPGDDTDLAHLIHQIQQHTSHEQKQIHKGIINPTPPLHTT